MPPIPPPFSIATVWDDTSRFVRREAGLLMPLAFATSGVGSLLWDLAVPVSAVGGRAAAGPWMLILLPVTFLLLIGNLAIAALVLNGGISVREALRAAVARIGNALAVLLLFLGVALGATLLGSMVAMLLGRVTGLSLDQSTSLALALLLPVVLYVGIRLLTLWPVVAAAPTRAAPIAAVKAAFRNTQGAFGRLAVATVLYALSYLAILGAIQFGLGSVLLLMGRALGQGAGFATLLSVLSALAGAALQAVWGVFAVFLYVRLGGDRQGI